MKVQIYGLTWSFFRQKVVQKSSSCQKIDFSKVTRIENARVLYACGRVYVIRKPTNHIFSFCVTYLGVTQVTQTVQARVTVRVDSLFPHFCEKTKMFFPNGFSCET